MNYSDVVEKVLNEGKEVNGTKEIMPFLFSLDMEEIGLMFDEYKKMFGKSVEEALKEVEKYESVTEAFERLKNESNDPIERRRHSLSFGEKLCFTGMQMFFDEKDLIVTFRSSDLIKKLPVDVYLMLSLANEFGIQVEKVFVFAGSIHVYDEDVKKFYDRLLRNT